MSKAIHVGVRAGRGPLPGYEWNVLYLSASRDDAMRFLDEVQYAHVSDLFKALASEEDVRRPTTVRVEQVEDFFELKDKGGILGKVNLRVYFIVDDRVRSVLVIAAINKDNEDQMPERAKIKVRSRIRRRVRGASHERVEEGCTIWLPRNCCTASVPCDLRTSWS